MLYLRDKNLEYSEYNDQIKWYKPQPKVKLLWKYIKGKVLSAELGNKM
jgi:hypothetical protein